MNSKQTELLNKIGELSDEVLMGDRSRESIHSTLRELGAVIAESELSEAEVKGVLRQHRAGSVR